jgi:hypothetical protein
MKLLPIGLLSAALSVSSFAGEMTVQSNQTTTQYPKTSTSLYNAGEWQVDLFGAYAFTDDDNRRLIGDDVFGGGLGINYYITRNFGIGLEGSLFDTEGDILGTGFFNVMLRFPIAETGLAPYIFGGAGVSFNADDLDSDDFEDARDRLEDDDDPRSTDDVLFLAHAGAGLEYRFSLRTSIFADARYTWCEEDDADFAVARAGIKVNF